MSVLNRCTFSFFLYVCIEHFKSKVFKNWLHFLGPWIAIEFSKALHLLLGVIYWWYCLEIRGILSFLLNKSNIDCGYWQWLTLYINKATFSSNWLLIGNMLYFLNKGMEWSLGWELLIILIAFFCKVITCWRCVFAAVPQTWSPLIKYGWIREKYKFLKVSLFSTFRSLYSRPIFLANLHAIIEICKFHDQVSSSWYPRNLKCVVCSIGCPLIFNSWSGYLFNLVLEKNVYLDFFTFKDNLFCISHWKTLVSSVLAILISVSGEGPLREGWRATYKRFLATY